MGRGKRPSRSIIPTWAELGAGWAERFQTTFARSSFRSLGRDKKQEVYQRLADEIVADVSVARPEWDSPSNRSWWATVLQARFGGNDFWMLSAAGKREHCQQVGREVALCTEIVATQGLLCVEAPSGPRSRPSSLAG